MGVPDAALRIAALFGLQDEAVALVEIDEVGGGGAVELFEDHRFINHIGVRLLVRGAGLRSRNLDEVAQLRQEECVIGTFRGGRSIPSGYEGLGSIRQGRLSLLWDQLRMLFVKPLFHGIAQFFSRCQDVSEFLVGD